MKKNRYIDLEKYYNEKIVELGLLLKVEEGKQKSKKIDILKEKIEDCKNKLELLPKSDVVLSLDNISMHFGGLKAVDKLSFDVKKGEIFGLIGPNGAGKTTVFNCITQFYKSTLGDIYYRNNKNKVVDLNKIKVHDVIQHGIIRTFQNVELVWELSILDNLKVAGHYLYKSNLFHQFLHTVSYKKEEKKITEKALDILEYLELLPYKDFPPVGLPYGILKRIELARTLMCNPKLIILDEPAAGLNEKETEDLAALIVSIKDKYKCTIFLVEHDMSLVMEICDTICAISFGKKLAIGSPEEVQNNAFVQEAYLGGE